MSIGSARTFQHPEDKGSLLAWGGSGLNPSASREVAEGVCCHPATRGCFESSQNKQDPKRVME